MFKQEEESLKIREEVVGGEGEERKYLYEWEVIERINTFLLSPSFPFSFVLHLTILTPSPSTLYSKKCPFLLPTSPSQFFLVPPPPTIHGNMWCTYMRKKGREIDIERRKEELNMVRMCRCRRTRGYLYKCSNLIYFNLYQNGNTVAYLMCVALSNEDNLLIGEGRILALKGRKGKFEDSAGR